jgi:glycosyltransferase involved in cell wall biosynthesis
MRILHVFRTPVGGLFRHVRDLARGQHALGHEVGLICDSTTGGAHAERLLAGAEAHCGLGIIRIPMSRLPGIGDVMAVRQATERARHLSPSVIHCHGAKGGLFGRIAARRLGIASLYTPHGGTLHYRWASPHGFLFLAAEWGLAHMGQGLHFVCRYERDCFAAKIGLGHRQHIVVHNGLWPEEFASVAANADAADVLFIGDMRRLKGVDVLLEALAIAGRTRPVTAALVGDGADLETFKAKARALGLAERVIFAGRLPAAQAFPRGRLLVMPSRAESFPYVVLEAAAAALPIIASDVGGIGEVLGKDSLVPPGDANALARRLLEALADPAVGAAAATRLRDRVAQEFTAGAMVRQVTDFYHHLGAR